MKVEPIRHLLRGERVVAVSPAMAPYAPLSWHRRLKLYTGRTLSDTALIAEQEGRAGRLATRGQELSPGVVSGLEVDLERDGTGRYFYHIAAGSGITVSGEDVIVPRPLRVAFGELPVYAPPALLRGPGDSPDSGQVEAPRPGGLQVRRLGRTLAKLIEVRAPLPSAGILVLQPVVTELVGRFDPDDPCEEDPQNYAFEDWQLADGCRLVFYAWPADWEPLPERDILRPVPKPLPDEPPSPMPPRPPLEESLVAATPNGPEAGILPNPVLAPDPRWRNRLAYTIFRRELNNGPDQPLPWEELGVPICLVGFDANWTPIVVDRYSVVRAGGRPKRRSMLAVDGTAVLSPGNPFLWQARIQQLAEHLADPQLANLSVDQQAARLRYIPPVGLLPKAAVEPRAGRGHFFPSTFSVDAVPIPLEQLDAVLAAGASLAPFDTFTSDQVRVLVPVPQAWYEPGLLQQEAVSLEFQKTIDRFVTERAKWLNRREIVRKRAAPVTTAITGKPPTSPRPEEDPGRLEPETSTPPVPFSSTKAHQSDLRAGLHQHLFTVPVTPGSATLAVAAGEMLTAYVYLDADHPPRQIMLQWADAQGTLEHRAYWGENLIQLGVHGTNSRRAMGALPPAGTWVRLAVPASQVGLEGVTLSGMAFTLMEGRAAWAHAGKATLGALPANDTVWVGNALPAGANQQGNEPWSFVEGEELLTPFEDDFQTRIANGVRVVTPFEALKEQLRTSTPIRSETADDLAQLPAGLQFPTDLQPKIRFDAARTDLIFRGVMTVQERDRLLSLSADAGYRESVNDLFTRSQKDELSQLDRLGLEAFITMLEQKVNSANDRIDFGFLRVQTDIYRFRQLMLGSDAAARLATSTTLATIAKGESALATREDLNKFLERLRQGVSRGAEEAGEDSAAARAGTLSFSGRVSPTSDVFLAGSDQVGDSARPAAATSSFTTSRERLDAESSAAPAFPTRRQTDGFGSVPPPPRPPSPTPTPTPSPAPTPAPTDKVIQQPPIVGKPYDFRTVSVAERITEAAAPEAKSFSVASKSEVFKTLAELDINLDDLLVPGFLELNPNGSPVTETVLVNPLNTANTKLVPKETRRSFREIRKRGLASEILADRHDPDPINADNAAFFSAGVRALDHTTAVLRIVEGRIQAYRNAISLCRQALAELRALAGRVEGRLTVIGDELAEARHDVSVARALLAEETSRVQAVNDRRDLIIREQVPFLAYYRPRTTDLLMDTPVRSVDPGPMESPVPACLAEDVVVPTELHGMVDLLREVPVRWFTHMPRLLDRLDRLEVLHGALELARARAQVAFPTHQALGQAGLLSGQRVGGLLGQAISQVFIAQQQVLSQRRLLMAQLDTATLAGLSWKLAREQAVDNLSLGDLIDGRHGRSDVAQRASRELDDISHVAGCLHLAFGRVLPILRLDWAERLSQFDAPFSLRNLANLPRWGEVELLDRREMQALVDWLFQRVDPQQHEAVALINDLVRVCILLASHAPVKQIIAGHVAAPTSVQTGGRVELRVEPGRVRVGMHVLMFAGDEVVARGIVDDLAAGQAAARVVQLKAGARSVNLAQGARVHFAESDGSDGGGLAIFTSRIGFQQAQRSR